MCTGVPWNNATPSHRTVKLGAPEITQHYKTCPLWSWNAEATGSKRAFNSSNVSLH